MCCVLLFSLLFAFVLEAAESRKINVAVSDFTNKTGDEANKKYVGFTSETLLDLLLKTKRFDVISRDAMKQILKEKALDQTSITDAGDVKKLKRILNAEFLIYGELLTVSAVRGEAQYTPAKYKTTRKVVARDPSTNRPTKWKEEKKLVRKEKTVYPIMFSVSISGKLTDVATTEIISAATKQATVNISAKSKEEADNQFNAAAIHVQKAIRKACADLIKNFVSDIPIVGTVIKINRGEVIVDIGRKIGLFKKANLSVYTTESIDSADYGSGTEKVNVTKEVAVLRVTELHDTFCYTQVFQGSINNIEKGMNVRVIPPRFKAAYVIPSILVPGLGQMIAGNVWSGFGWLIGAGGFASVGAAMLAADLFAPSTEGLLDTVIRDGGTSRDPSGTTDEQGRVEGEVLNTHSIIAYSLIGVGALLYIWNIFDAGYPAEKNPVFETKTAYKEGNVVPLFGVRHTSLLAGLNNNPVLYDARARREDVSYYVGAKVFF